MYARMTKLKVPLDKLEMEVAASDEATERVSRIPGSRGLYFLVDRSNGSALAVTLWETEQALRDSRGLADQMSAERHAENGAEVVSVSDYEVVAEPFKTSAAAYGRMTAYLVPLDRLDEDVAGAPATEKKLAEIPGSLGLFYLVDRSSGRTIAITMWESEQAMRESEAAASLLRGETSSAVSAKVLSIERYEVVQQPAYVPARWT